jgi:hypothetical protein
MTGDTGVFITDTLPELGQAVRQVYRFAHNSGLRFYNDSANNFFGDIYTIEMYFRFDNLSSWRRVIDWKNRKSDGGAYFYNNQLNFYPLVYSGVAPVVPNEYTYYVVTRDSSTKEVLIYADANVHATFTDNSGMALLDTANILNFFQDDNVVANEASAGAIAQLKIYNYKLSDTVITQNYNNLPSEIMSVRVNEKANNLFKVYPNPASEVFTLYWGDLSASQSRIDIFNSAAQLVLSRKTGTSSEQVFTNHGLSAGFYIVRLSSPNQKAYTRLIIR